MADNNRQVTEADERIWHVRLEDLEFLVRGAYPTKDEKLQDGWTVIKDHRHKIVAAVRDDCALYIERTDAVVDKSESREAQAPR
jgi:hypothetical protein